MTIFKHQNAFEEYEKDLKNNLYKLWNQMSSGSYFLMEVKGVEIQKKNGKKRLLGVPTIADRVAQMLLRMNFEPLVEPIFNEDSFGYWPNRLALNAVGVARERCWKLPRVLEFNIKRLLDNIDHSLMMQAVRQHLEPGHPRLDELFLQVKPSEARDALNFVNLPLARWGR